MNEKEGLPTKTLEPEAIELLCAYRWPGNVRELENLVRRLAALYPQQNISAATIEAELAQSDAAPVPTGEALSEHDPRLDGRTSSAALFRVLRRAIASTRPVHRILEEVEAPLISAALAATRGNQIKAAHLLGLNRNTLRKKISDLDIQVMKLSR